MTDGIDDLSPYQVHSRREIIALLRNIGEHNQLLRMQINNGVDSIVTSILSINEAENVVLIDVAPGALLNQRILESDNIAFETVLEHIRILFFANQVRSRIYEKLPAYQIAIPSNVIRLQRRENYRVPTPLANPVRCTIKIPHEDPDGTPTTAIVTLQNVSGGGIAIVDDRNVLDTTVGRIYKDCRIDLPGGTLVITTLEIRNSHETVLANGKVIRRVGCLFVNLPKAMLAAVQRYITKLERERNAKETGLS
jgi:c-di-GMP-binding flagellar brake protein YcgR